MQAIDWRVVFMLPPKRRFTAAELERAGPTGFSATFKATVGLNLALTAAMLLALAPRVPLRPAVFMAGFLPLVLAAGMAAWRNPSGAAARGAYWFIPAAAGAALGALATAEMIDRRNLLALMQMVALGVLGLWFTIVYRHQYIESRLREAAEREKAVEMARRLAAAQVEPHFLFNTLASVQHWVQTKDDRAAPLLAALTGYLRATLPLFNRPLLPAGDELVAVTRYLEVMQARMGPRLAWRVAVAPPLERALLPPGLLLTLVENAVVHGVEPQVDGGQIVLTGEREGADAVFAVCDTGTGPAGLMQDGVGLANARQRLELALGPGARLQVGARPEGGCRAEVRLPFHAGPP